MERYQDIWLKGQCVSKGVRECADRYEIIKNFCSQYKRPFTVLDIGACIGYFSIRLTEDFNDCTAVAIEGNSAYQKNLLEILKQNDTSRVIVLAKTVSIDDLRQLAEVSHIDVVLALSVIHHLNGSYDESIQVLRSIGEHLIIELPVEDKACGQHIVQSVKIPEDAKVLGYGKSHLDASSRPIVLLSTPKPTIKYAYLGTPCNDLSMTITSSFDSKVVEFHNKKRKRNWHRGINLQTYLKWNGVYPDRETVVQMIRDAWDGSYHGDLQVWNMIIQGNAIKIIDQRDPFKGIYADDIDAIVRGVSEWQG